MKDVELNILINSLKAQVNVLEAKIKDIQKAAKPKKFAGFYGVFAELGKTFGIDGYLFDRADQIQD